LDHEAPQAWPTGLSLRTRRLIAQVAAYEHYSDKQLLDLTLAASERRAYRKEGLATRDQDLKFDGRYPFNAKEREPWVSV
jgi:hypothetical protein